MEYTDRFTSGNYVINVLLVGTKADMNGDRKVHQREVEVRLETIHIIELPKEFCTP